MFSQEGRSFVSRKGKHRFNMQKVLLTSSRGSRNLESRAIRPRVILGIVDAQGLAFMRYHFLRIRQECFGSSAERYEQQALEQKIHALDSVIVALPPEEPKQKTHT